MLHILIGGAGFGKSTYLIQHLQGQLEAGEKILTLVPEQFSYEFDQKLYRILGPVAFNQLETHSFKSLARAVFQRFGCVPDGKTNADELTKMALLYQAVLQVSERGKTVPAGFVCQRIGNDVYPVSPQRNPAGTAVQFQCGTERQIAGKDAGRV